MTMLRPRKNKQVTVRMRQANVRRRSDELLHLLRNDGDVFDVEGLGTHHLPLESAADGNAMFKEKRDGCIKVVLRP